jgi:hypothetical protein
VTLTERLLWAYRFGHSWNEAYPNLHNLDEASVAKMDGSEADAKSLLASWQQIDANVERLVNAFHGRELEPDGEIGPASAAVMDMKRCAMPDYAPPGHASFHYDDPELQAAVESYQRYAAAYVGGSGSWPKAGCDPQRMGIHSTRVNIDTSAASTHQKGILKQACGYTEACEAEFGQAVRHIFDGDKSQCETDTRFQGIAGSVIGFCYFPEPDTCNQTVTCRIDNGYNPSAITLANLLTHEYKGHGDGLEHTNGGIMNPSIITYNPLTWKGDKHESTKRRYFGGEPVPPLTPPVPPAHPPVTGQLYVENGIIIRGDVQFDGKWKYVATPDGGNRFKLVPKAEV